VQEPDRNIFSFSDNPAHSGRSAHQARVELDGVRYLVRAIVEPGDPLAVITVYRTSKIGKYWREDA
jgi:hypothetical protein